MDTKSPILTTAEYEAVVKAALAAEGIDSATAEVLLQARWPMLVDGVLSEAAGRGRRLAIGDIAAFLGQRYNQAVEPDSLAYLPTLVDALLSWAAENDVGEPTISAVVLERRPEIITRCQRAEAFHGN